MVKVKTEDDSISSTSKFKTEEDSISSTSIIDTVNGSLQFVVKGYSLAKGVGAGKCLQSNVFKVGGYDWAIYFYPDGKHTEDNALYVSVFIALASEATDVRALFELTLVDQSGKGKHKVHSHFERAVEVKPYTLKCKGSMWGYKRFFRRTILETSDYLKDDCLVMNCTVGVVRTRQEGLEQYSIHVPPSDMDKGFKEMLESEAGCDVVFQVGGETFKAHKFVLAARSPVFRIQFFGVSGDSNTSEVVIEDIEPSVFKAMLLFIYTDKIPDVNEITGSPSRCSFTNIVEHLLAVADRFSLDRLKVLCESKLCEDLNAKTVATTLEIAEQHHCLQLKSVCLKFAASPTNLGDVMQSEGFKHLERNHPSLLSEMLKTCASGDDNSSFGSSKKRSSSSVVGLNLAPDGVMTESENLSGRRTRRKFYIN